MKKRITIEDEMANYINPTMDIVIRYLFGTQERKDLLLSLINAVQEESGFPKIAEIEIIDPTLLPRWKDEKLSIIDMHAIDEHGHQYDIEVQSANERGFRERMLYYWARMYGDQLEKGSDYWKLRPVILIGLLDFDLFPDEPRYHLCFAPTEIGRPDLRLTPHMVMHFLQLPRVDEAKLPGKWGPEKMDKLRKWLEFLRHEGKDEEKVRKLSEDDPEIAKAHEAYEEFIADKQMRLAYEMRFKAVMDHNWRIEGAKATGLELGLKQGIEQGIEQGLKKGREEGALSERERLATSLRKKGFSEADIDNMF